jgi:hypothetical protein
MQIEWVWILLLDPRKGQQLSSNNCAGSTESYRKGPADTRQLADFPSSPLQRGCIRFCQTRVAPEFGIRRESLVFLFEGIRNCLRCSLFAKLRILNVRLAHAIFALLNFLVYVLEYVYVRFVFH